MNLEEYLGNEHTGIKYKVLISGPLTAISNAKPYKSIKEIFKVCFFYSS